MPPKTFLITGLIASLLLFSVCTATTTTVAARASLSSSSLNPTEVAAIESYSQQLDRSVRRGAFKGRYFADVSSQEAENAQPQWREFNNKRALDRAWSDGKTYTSAIIWLKAGRTPVVTDFTLSSPSGDWKHDVTNYYRDDGTLAKTQAELRTFYGDVIVLRTRYYSPEGKLLSEKTRYLDLTTRKPKKVKEGDFMNQEPPVYAKTSSLPFYSLLQKP